MTNLIEKLVANAANVEIDFAQKVAAPEENWQSAWGNYTAYKAPFTVLGGIDNQKDLTSALWSAVTQKYPHSSSATYIGDDGGFVFWASYYSIGD